MTIDDEKSVYVGGLPYDITEEAVRRSFDLYGRVVAVKLVNDHGVGGKCFGFVTFTNPRSAVDAINDMSGRTIGGRQVVVNEVKTRGGRPNFGRELRPNFERGDRDRGRGRDRDFDRGRDRQWDRSKGLSQDRFPDRERSNERGRDYDHRRVKDRFLDDDRARSHDRDLQDNEPERDRKRDREWKDDRDSEDSQDREMDRSNGHHETGDKDRDQTPKKSNGSNLSDHSRELSSESDDDDQEVKKDIEATHQRLEELKKQITRMEELAEEKQQLVAQLQDEAQNFEDELTVAKKLTSHRHVQLAKLHRCFQHVKDYGEKLKASEHELEALVDATMMEIDASK